VQKKLQNVMGGASGMTKAFEAVENAVTNVRVATKNKISYISGHVETCGVSTSSQLWH